MISENSIEDRDESTFFMMELEKINLKNETFANLFGGNDLRV